MQKRISCVALAVILLLSLFCGCGAAEHALITQARQSDVIDSAGLSKAEIAGNAYGEIAYQYLEYIQEALPGRLAFTQKEKEAATFIVSAVLDMGYPPGCIEVQDFSYNGASAFLSAEATKEFNGGEKVDGSQNIIVTKKGDSKKTIIVGAHYDSAATHGVDDNGSGVAVVLENALRMVGERTPYTIKYLFFGYEESALRGSRVYLNSLSDAEKENIVFMVNLDSVIGGDTCYLYGGALQNDGTVTDTEAVLKAYEYVENLGLDIHVSSGENESCPFPMGTLAGDNVPFMESGIPYIQCDAITYEKDRAYESKQFPLIMHTPNDDLDFINKTFPNRVNKALASYSTLLDHMLKDGTL